MRFFTRLSYGLGPLALVVFARSPAHAREHILGLVEIPKLFGEADPQGPPGQIRPKKITPLDLRAEPGRTSNVVGRVRSADEIESREHGYEVSSAVVYGRTDEWSKVKTPTTEGWLAPGDAGRFHPYEALIKSSGYLSGDWNGYLHSSPGAKDVKRLTLKTNADGDAASWMIARARVRVLATKRFADELWVQVQLLNGTCNEPEVPGAKGWVPAYDEAGAENFWFHARGC